MQLAFYEEMEAMAKENESWLHVLGATLSDSRVSISPGIVGLSQRDFP